MQLSLDNLHVTVVQAMAEERDWLFDALKFDEPGARYSATFKAKSWDGTHRLYNKVLGRFPAGLLGLVQLKARETTFPVEVTDRRTRIEPFPVPTPWLDRVREQPQALEACLSRGRGVVWAPTGSGKTEVIVGLGAMVPCRWLILTHKAQLLSQIQERFLARTGEEVGICGDGIWQPRRITVATFQTLYKGRRLAAVRTLVWEAQGLIVDECHVLPAGTFRAVVSLCPNAFWRFGFSATPFNRRDNRDLLLAAATGPVIFRVKAGVLIERGVLSRPAIRFVLHEQEDAGVIYTDTYRLLVVESETRNKLIVEIARKAAKPCLLFVREVDHGRRLARELEGADLRVAFVHGTDSVHKRKQGIKLLRRNDLDVLIASDIFDAGIDIPEVASVVNAAGGRSPTQAIQRLGRGMRTTEAKSSIDFWDVNDVGSAWLKDHSESRRGAYTEEGYEVQELAEVSQA